MTSTRITRSTDPRLDELCEQLAALAPQLDGDQPEWPAEQLGMCGRYGVYEWFIVPEQGGQGWSPPEIVEAYLRLSAACLTTTFIITQRTGACGRLAASSNERARQQWLPRLLTEHAFATLGISHLTTSRRHLGQPVMAAEPTADGAYLLDGYTPWVTGARHAQMVVVGATQPDGRQLLVALPTDLPGVSAPRPARLVGLSASHTGSLVCDRVRVAPDMVLAGPSDEILQGAAGASTGGLQTSTLAVGLAGACVALVQQQAAARAELRPAAEALAAETEQLRQWLRGAARGASTVSAGQLRSRANSLVLRASQASLAAAKGAGYVIGHPAGRYCREALFFLVWSCPQPVAEANLCELAGLS